MNDFLQLDLEATECIINSAEAEDVVILNEHYRRLLEELPEGEQRTRYVVLSRKTKERMNELRVTWNTDFTPSDTFN
jgi:hypothetical protein